MVPGPMIATSYCFFSGPCDITLTDKPVRLTCEEGILG